VRSATVIRNARYLLAAKLILSAGLLYLVLAQVRPSLILGELAKANLWLVLASYSLVPIAVLLSAWRWETLAPSLTFRTALKYTWIGVFYSHVLPGAISGDIAKGVSLAIKDKRTRANVLAASIFADRAVGLAALLIFFDVACVIVYYRYGKAFAQLRHLALIAIALSFVAILGAVVVLRLAVRFKSVPAGVERSFLGHARHGLIGAIKVYSQQPSMLAKSLAISVVIHLLNIVALYISLQALSLDVSVLFPAIVYPVLSVMLMIPISVSGIGVRDATLAVLFPLFGLPPASGVAIS
jgi:glycosyltransferase 2 family protein